MPANKAKLLSGDASDPATRLVEVLKERIHPERFRTWFGPAPMIMVNHGVLEIKLPNDLAAECVCKRFSAVIFAAAQHVFAGMPQVHLIVATDTGLKGERRIRLSESSAMIRRSFASEEDDTLNLKQVYEPKFDLETFVTGSGNVQAYEAVCSIVAAPAGEHNPLFVYGGTGLGKTHLLHGLYKKFLQKSPVPQMKLVTGKQFATEFREALMTEEVPDFRQMTREVALLIVDDFHHLSSSQRVQEEFLSTLSAIMAEGGQVVMASQIHPSLHAGLSVPLKERILENSRTVCIESPDFQMRCDYLRVVSNKAGITLPDDVIAWIAHLITQNVSDLADAVALISERAKLTLRAPDLSTVEALFRDIKTKASRPPSSRVVLRVVADYFHLDTKDLSITSRDHTISLARALAAYLLRTMAGFTYPKLARVLGAANHTSVMSSYRRIDQALKKGEPFEWNDVTGKRKVPSEVVVGHLRECVQTAQRTVQKTK